MTERPYLPPDRDLRRCAQLGTSDPAEDRAARGSAQRLAIGNSSSASTVWRTASARVRARTGDNAALFAPNCLEFVEIALGLAAAGVPPAMVNARSTPAELAHIANDSRLASCSCMPPSRRSHASAELDTVDQIVVIGGDYDD